MNGRQFIIYHIYFLGPAEGQEPVVCEKRLTVLRNSPYEQVKYNV